MAPRAVEELKAEALNCEPWREESDGSTGSKIGTYKARLHNDDIWRDENNDALNLSASDLERHEYCPMSWALSREGNSGQGEAIEAGAQKHAEIHEQMESFKEMKSSVRRATIIWTWWFSVTVAFVIDGIAFNYIDDVRTDPLDLRPIPRIVGLGAADRWTDCDLLAMAKVAGME